MIFEEKYKDCIEARALNEIQVNKNGNLRKPRKWKKIIKEDKIFELEIRELFFLLGATYFNEEKFDFCLKDYSCPKDKRDIDAIGLIENKYLIMAECKWGTQSRAVEDGFETVSTYKDFIKKRINRIFKNKDIVPIWVLASNGSNVTDDRKRKYLASNVIYLDENEIQYIKDCYETSKSKKFTFNQFLGLYMNNEEIFPALKVGAVETERNNQGGKAYSFKVDAGDFMNLCFVSHRRAKDTYSFEGNDGNYQRILTKGRLSNIAEYLDNGGGPFINNVLVSFRGNDRDWKLRKTELTEFGGSAKLLKVPGKPGSFHVIDGQHRLFAYMNVENEEVKKQDLLITCFKGLTQAEEAEIFVDVNGEQKKVNAALMAEIQVLLGKHSTGVKQIQNLATSILTNLRDNGDSPFKDPKAIPEAEKTSLLSIPTLRDILCKQTNLLGQKNQFSMGYFAKNNDFEETLEFATDFLSQFFWDIRNILSPYWKKPISGSHPVKMHFIGGMLLVLDRMISRATDGKINNPKEISEKIKLYREELLKNLKDISGNPEMMEVMFDWKKDGVKLIEGGKKYPTARSYIIEFFLKERFPELWSEKVDSELTKKTHEVYEEIAKISELEEKIKELKKELSTPVEKNDYEELAGEKSKKYEEFCRNYLHQQLMDHFKDESSYWSFFRSNELGNPTDPYKHCEELEGKMMKEEQAEKRKYGEATFKPYKYKISYANWTQIRKMLVLLHKFEKEFWKKYGVCYEIDNYQSFESGGNSSDLAKIEDWIIFMNKIRRFEGGGHTGLETDHVPSDTKKAKDTFAYYDEELQKKFSIFEKTLEENEDGEDKMRKTQAKIDDDLEQY